jgi:hypothetical protein
MQRGIGIFGSAYRVLFERDVHAPGSVDRVLLERMALVETATRERLYRPPPPVRYAAGSRPELEEILRSVGVAGIPAFTASLASRAPDRLDDMIFGGTEEEIVRRGSDWCTDLARVACALHQVAGVPARVLFLVEPDRAYSCHVLAEAWLDGGWRRVDAVTGEVSSEPDPRAAAVAEYPIADRDGFDYTTSRASPYYRRILEMADAGWPGGLRWLFGEDEA